MSFRVRPLYERVLSKPKVADEEPQTQNVSLVEEELVFYVDEETGEIKEERVTKTVTSDSTSQPPNLVKKPSVTTTQPKKESSTMFHHKMKQLNRESFM